MTITFDSSIVRFGDDLDIEVFATVTRSSGMDDGGYRRGYVAEDIYARIPGGGFVPLTSSELSRLEDRAIEIAQNEDDD